MTQKNESFNLFDGSFPSNICVLTQDGTETNCFLRPSGYNYLNPYGLSLTVRYYATFHFMNAPMYMPEIPKGEYKLSYHGDNPPGCPLPVISHVNPSPRLLKLAKEVDIVTPKQICLIDAWAVSEQSRQILQGMNSASWRETPDKISIVIDSNVCHEGIMAHELMHVWLDLIEDYEDHRRYRDTSNGKNAFAVISAQSFVLDCMVQKRLKERGFSMEYFTRDLVDSLYENAVAAESGVLPHGSSVETVIARLLSRPWAVPELFDLGNDDWDKIRYAKRIFKKLMPDTVYLSKQITKLFKRYNYESKSEMPRLIDEIINLHFRYIDEPFELSRDLIMTHDQITYSDKFPNKLPNVPPQIKYEIHKRLIRDKLPTGTKVAIEWINGNLHVKFILQPNSIGDRQAPKSEVVSIWGL